MSYTLIPNSGQSLGQTRAPIRTNFQLLQTTIDQNHIDMNDSGAGKHKFVQMPEQASAPTTAANEGGVYTKVGTSPAETNLFFRGESSGFEYQLTKTISASTATFASATNGWTFLPGGLILQYGQVASPGSSGSVSFPITFPSGSAPYSIQVALNRNSGNQSVTVDDSPAPSSTGFDYLSSSGGSNILYWIAIGK